MRPYNFLDQAKADARIDPIRARLQTDQFVALPLSGNTPRLFRANPTAA